MKIPILNGVYVDGISDFRTSYPRNLIPVPKEQGISKGYLRPADGIVKFGEGPGVDRGGINWNGVCYRVMGSKLVTISLTGSVTILGDVGLGGQVTMDYSFDRLAIAANKLFFYWNGTTLTQVTDGDLGPVVDFIWVDSYFMTTDGKNLVVTELTDPFSVNPLKYGSAEANPDSILGILKLRNEVYALNRYTIEVFQNIGGALFPFARIEGAQMQRGIMGTFTASVYMESIAFLGSGVNESPAVWMGANSSTIKISTREIDQTLSRYTEVELASSITETRVHFSHEFLYLHLPDLTLVYDGAASKVVGEPVWFELTTSLVGLGQYRARNFVWCYNKWLCSDPISASHSYLTDTISSHYGVVNGWEFGTTIIYNESRGAIFHELELICLTGSVELNKDTTIWTSYTVDGINWSQEKPRSAGRQGERLKRLSWLQQGHMGNWRIQKFRGNSDAHISIAAFEAEIEALN